MKEKQAFEQFIEQLDSVDIPQKMALFQQYHAELLDANIKVNLVSRKTLPEEFWSLHFLDSLVPMLWFSFAGATILDFGTGGGLPGIPLKIMHPDAEVHLLDSRAKKITAIKNMVKNLDVTGCFTIVSRLEEMGEMWRNRFDFIVCRSVRIEPRYVQPLLKMVKPGGRILLYKSKKLDDVELFKSARLHHWMHPLVGERTIVEIRK
jgi:16S rRNA (guanine527-N7)-methyltransferase